MIRSLFAFILSIQLTVAPVAAIAGESCMKAPSYSTDSGLSVYEEAGAVISGIYNHITTDGSWVKYGVGEKKEALKKLRSYFFVEVARNNIRLQSLIYCLTKKEEIRPRSIGNIEFTVPMYDVRTTCSQRVDELIDSANKTLKKARIALALTQTATSRFRIETMDSKYYRVMEPNISHPFSDLPDMKALSRPEAQAAYDLFMKDTDSARSKWMKKACYNKSDFKELSGSERREYYTSDYNDFNLRKKRYNPAYFEAMGEMPVIGYLPNYLTKSKSLFARAINKKILRTGYFEIEKINCKLVIKNLVPNGVKLRRTSYNRKKSFNRGELADLLCKYNSGSPERITLMEKYKSQMLRAYAVLDRAKRYEHEAPRVLLYKDEFESFLAEGTTKASNENLVGLLKDFESQLRGVPDRSSLEKLVKVPSHADEEYDELLEFAWFLPVIERFVSHKPFAKYKKILYAINKEFHSTEMKSDLIVVGETLVAMGACWGLLSKVGPGKLIKFSGAIFGLFKKLGFRELCFFGGGVFMDTYFLNIMIGRFDRTHDAFFSAADAEVNIANIKSLEDEQFGLFLEKMFFGLGVVFWGVDGYRMIKNFRKVEKTDESL